MISYEELTGYFDLESDDGYEFKDGNYCHYCLACWALVMAHHLENHVRWHKEIHKPDKDKTPVEIRAEAKRELERLKSNGTVS